MGKTGAVWGIDIGQCALKALRCRAGESPGQITADAFDYVEYPKILSQPEADPAQLVREALQTFLSRNSVRGDRVAISVSGQSGLARFIKLPPVEAKKIPDIVKYEARQQIPFPLDDVVWDYQRMAGGSEQEGFAMETEVGLFAMKRDQAGRALKPFDEAGIEVDAIQLSPLAIYNFTVFDQMHDLPAPEQYDPESPPESVVVISVGTDTTDLVITNGYRVWQRNVPIGGSHFTKALTKELRLTFGKAEHLKRNASQADDPKAVYQAMRPVFNDMLTEIQRSIGFFTSLDRKASIGRVVALGNAMKLPGLQKYLAQNLGYPVAEVESYRGLAGSGVVGSSAFKENLLSFAVCYGLALQGLGEAKLATNLLPREIVTNRLIRAKKPWALAAAATIVLGCAVGYGGAWWSYNSVRPDRFAQAFKQVEDLKSKSSGFKSAFEEQATKYKNIDTVGKTIAGFNRRRTLWPQFFKVIDACLPRDKGDDPSRALDEREEINIDSIEFQPLPNLQTWYATVAKDIKERKGPQKPAAAAAPAAATAPAAPPADTASTAAPAAAGDEAQPAAARSGEDAPTAAPASEGPQGPGVVVQIRGHHYHNKPGSSQSGSLYVDGTLVKALEEVTVELPDPADPSKTKKVQIKQLGIAYPVLINSGTPQWAELPGPGGSPAPPGRVTTVSQPGRQKVLRFDFTLQFCWQDPALKIAEAAATSQAPPAAAEEQ